MAHGDTMTIVDGRAQDIPAPATEPTAEVQTEPKEQDTPPVEAAIDDKKEEPDKDTGDTGDPETGDNQDKPEDGTEPKRKSRAEERIRSLVDINKELRAENEQLRAQVKPEVTTRQPEPAATDPGPMPRIEQYDFDPEEFNKAVEAWTEKKTAHAKEAARREIAYEAHRAAVEAKVAKAVEKYPDFNEVVNENPILEKHFGKENSEVGLAISAQPDFADLAYYFGSNPAEAAKIAKMDPVSAGMEIERVRLKLSTPDPAAAPKKEPKKEPFTIPKTLGGGGSPAIEPGKMSMEQYAEHFKKQRAAD